MTLGGNRGCFDWHPGFHTEKSQIAFQIEANQLAGDLTRCVHADQLDVDWPLAVGVAKDMATGQHQSLVTTNIDNGTSAVGMSIGVFYLDTNGRGEKL